MKSKLLICLFLSVLMAFGSFTACAQSTRAVGVLIVDDIDSGDPYLLTKSAVVSDDVYYDGKILIAAGTPVIMDISYQHRHGLGVPASVAVRPVSTTDIYGQLWPLESDSRTATGANRRGAAIGCGVFFGVVAFPVGLLFLCIKGGKAVIAAGTQMVATIRIEKNN